MQYKISEETDAELNVWKARQQVKMFPIVISCMLVSSFSVCGQQANYIEKSFYGTVAAANRLKPGSAFNACVTLNCGSNTVQAVMNVTASCNCTSLLPGECLIVDVRNFTLICQNRHNCSFPVDWKCDTAQENTLEIVFTCSEVNLSSTQYPLTTHPASSSTSACGAPCPTDGDVTQGRVSTYQTTRGIPGDIDKTDIIIINLILVSVLFLIAFFAVIAYVFCKRRRCICCKTCNIHDQDMDLPDDALARQQGVPNTTETSSLEAIATNSSSSEYEIKTSDGLENIYSEVDLEDLEGSSEVASEKQTTDVDREYNDLYTEIDIPVTVIRIRPSLQEPTTRRDVTPRKDAYDHISLDRVFEPENYY